MKIDRSSRSRRVFTGVLGAVLVLCLAPFTRGQVLLSDTWADGDHTDGDAGLPAESPVWSGHPDSLTSTTGTLSAVVGTNSMKVWTYYADDGGEVALAVGEKLVVSVEMILKGGLYDQASRGFRVGLYSDPTSTQVRANVNDDGGGNGDPWQDATGYAVELALSSGPVNRPNLIQWFKRVNTNASLLGSSGAMSPASSGGKPITVSLDRPYTLNLEIAFVSASRVDLTCSIADATGVLATQTVRDDGSSFSQGDLPDSDKPFTTFEQLFIRTGNQVSTADGIDYRGVKVERVPAPGS